MPLRDDLIEALTLGDDEVRPFANKLSIRKIRVYRETLQRLADEHELPKPVLSSRLLMELYDEATSDAAKIIDTFNRRLPDVVDRAIALEPNPTRVLAIIEELLVDRSEKQAPVVSVTSLYGSYADATLQFHANAGVRPLFDFGGHGDADPACDLCRVIRRRNPHPLERVIEIGTPHHRCAQQWHPVGTIDMPAGYVPGVGGTVGIVGAGTLERRRGSLKAAVAAVEAMP